MVFPSNRKSTSCQSQSQLYNASSRETELVRLNGNCMQVEKNLNAEAAKDLAEGRRGKTFAFLCEYLCVLCG